MTDHPSINHATYFLQSSFTPDNRTLIFTSYRTGNAQLFEIDFPDGEPRQLTSGAAIHPFSPAIHKDGRTIYFVRAGEIWTIDRATRAERRVVAFPEAQLGECSLAPAADWITAAI